MKTILKKDNKKIDKKLNKIKKHDLTQLDAVFIFNDIFFKDYDDGVRWILYNKIIQRDGKKEKEFINAYIFRYFPEFYANYIADKKIKKKVLEKKIMQEKFKKFHAYYNRYHPLDPRNKEEKFKKIWKNNKNDLKKIKNVKLEVSDSEIIQINLVNKLKKCVKQFLKKNKKIK